MSLRTPVLPASILRWGVVAAALVALVLTAVVPAPAADAAGTDPSVDGCDPLDPAHCLLPFPSDAFTTADPTTGSGRRVDFVRDEMPLSQLSGQRVDPTEWNRNDGFSPGTPILTLVPGLDLPTTWGLADQPSSDVGINELGYFDHRDQLAHPERSLDADAPIVLLDADTGARHPFWSELDQSAGAGEDPLLIVRPAVNLAEGHRYVVALRDLRRADGSTIVAGEAFAALRDGTATGARADHYEALFATLADAGVAREDLVLAWDFTVASERNLTERALAMRDDAFASLGDTDLSDLRVQGDAPTFEVTTVTELDPASNNGTARRVEGVLQVPNYLDTDAGATGSRLNDTDGDGLPDRFGGDDTIAAPFICNLPAEAMAGGPRATPLVYGHGLLGSPREVNGQSGREMRELNAATCATPWIGMAEEDILTVVGLLQDISRFPTLADRAQQAFLNFNWLGRALVHPDGFASDPAFQVARGRSGRGTPAIRTAHGNSPSPLVYDGNSQGAIMGGSFMALAVDARRGVLGVAGMNYSTLLNRSVDWEAEPALSGSLYAAYGNGVQEQVVYGLLQMLWDRGETNGYAHHVTDDPLPNSPAHEVLLHVAWGDHQVANVSAEVEARTMGAELLQPALAEGLHWEASPYFTPTATYPHRGSAMVYWDSGNATPPNGNVPADQNGDPHEDPRREPGGAYQKLRFLTQGIVVDVCDGAPYRTDDHPEADGVTVCDGHPGG